MARATSSMMRHLLEAHFDGLPGPTHNYAGLSPGNVASITHGGTASSPRAAALQALAKMRLQRSLGVPQGILPPLPRPNLPFLHAMGFRGALADLLDQAARHPHLLAAAWSASSMWTANAATVAPSIDTGLPAARFVPANLATQLHRSLETADTADLLRRVFPESAGFSHRPPLPRHTDLGDEGAANHTRLEDAEGRGIHIFVHGRGAAEGPAPRRFPARQTRQASEAVARSLGLDPERTVHLLQHPDVIDAGVFHNDVIAVGTGRFLFAHARAWHDPDAVERLQRLADGALEAQVVTEDELPVAVAVSTYLFNSVVLDTDAGRHLIAPIECDEHPIVRAWLDAHTGPGCAFARVVTMDLRESMRNGGGPACLRLRVPLTPPEWAAVHPGHRLDDARLDALEAVVRQRWRDRVTPSDLRDPAFAREAIEAREAVFAILEAAPNGR